MKNGRQCRDCLMSVHKKCEKKFNLETICTHDRKRSKSLALDDDDFIISTDDIDARSSTPNLSRKPDSSVRESFRGFRNRLVRSSSKTSLPEFFKNDESDTNASSQQQKPMTPNQSSSKLVSVASSAYNKIRDFKSKRTSITDFRKSRILSDSGIFFFILSKNSSLHSFIFIFSY